MDGSVVDKNHEWSFCFNGIQLFVNISSADHKILRSRNLGRHLTLVINPRENFDAVASVHTRSGRLVRERIRSRIAEFNGGLLPPELGFYGDADNREWQQYQLHEEGIEKPARCPFRKNRFE
ncbi:YqcI/YcgG family protein [Burkholderia guangdongensis]|uniref:YqcI/YcgG family protein n=1 Tax=Burkholderia guangdongensis TaxID=1792500 RepID=UPI001C53D7E8|nr:YqcI/YcgG family protein [Burkholderia guangdongensis]